MEWNNFAGLILVVPPSDEPIELNDAKTHLRVDVDFTLDDSYINLLITFARQQVETIMRRALLTQQWRLSLKQWPGRNYPSEETLVSDLGYFGSNYFKVPLPPLQSVQSVVYIDTDGNYYTMPQGGQVPSSPPSGNLALAGCYNVFTDFEPGRIVLGFSQIWPTVILLPGAPIQVSFTCGYVDLLTLQACFEGFPATIHAIKMIIGYLYENRIPPSEMRRSFVASGINYVIEELLEPYRIS